MSGCNLLRAKFIRSRLDYGNLSGADLRRAVMRQTRLGGANFKGANMGGVDLRQAWARGADFSDTILKKANMKAAILYNSNMVNADLTGASLVGVSLSRVDLSNSILNECKAYGVSIWDTILENSSQTDIDITPEGRGSITVDNMKIAQFIYLILNNSEIRGVIDSISSKMVLILGRFTSDRKEVLDAIRGKLRTMNFTPVLFDFEGPSTRDITETIVTLAHLSKFIIADITDAKSIPQELMAIIPHLPSVPVQPILLSGASEWGMYEHFEFYPWVLPKYEYKNLDDLMDNIEIHVVKPANDRSNV